MGLEPGIIPAEKLVDQVGNADRAHQNLTKIVYEKHCFSISLMHFCGSRYYQDNTVMMLLVKLKIITVIKDWI